MVHGGRQTDASAHARRRHVLILGPAAPFVSGHNPTGASIIGCLHVFVVGSQQVRHLRLATEVPA